MTHKRTRLMMALAGAGLLAMTQAASAVTANQSGNWTDTGTWSGGTLPTDGQTVITSGSDIDVMLNSDVGVTINYFENRSNGGSLTIEDGGVLGWTGSFEASRNTGLADASGSITMTGGTLVGGDSSKVKVSLVQSTGNDVGTFTQSGGTIVTNGLLLTGVLAVGATGTQSGTYNLSGTGSLTVTGDIDPGAGTAALNFTGGTLRYRGTLMDITNGGGTLDVGGAGGTNATLLRSAGSNPEGFDYTQNSGTISFQINALDDFSNIGTNSTQSITTGSNNVTLNGTMLINVASGLTLTAGDSFDLITTANIADSSIIDNTTLQILGLTSGTFTRSIVAGTGDSDILRLTYVASVPEPASLALLALGGLTLLPRRRRA